MRLDLQGLKIFRILLGGTYLGKQLLHILIYSFKISYTLISIVDHQLRHVQKVKETRDTRISEFSTEL